MALSKTAKLQILKEALRIVENKESFIYNYSCHTRYATNAIIGDGNTGLCHLFFMLLTDRYGYEKFPSDFLLDSKIRCFIPEFICPFEDMNPHVYWWPLKDVESRINYLKDLIKCIEASN